MPSKSDMTFWEKDGELLTKRRYRAYAKQASRKQIPVAELLGELGYVNTFSGEKIPGRPKKDRVNND